MFVATPPTPAAAQMPLGFDVAAASALTAPSRTSMKVWHRSLNVLERVPLLDKQIDDYAEVVEPGTLERIRELAEPLRGKRVLHVNATAYGGGQFGHTPLERRFVASFRSAAHPRAAGRQHRRDR